MKQKISLQPLMFWTLILAPVLGLLSCQKEGIAPEIPATQATYTLPSEEVFHEGTWLQWPHDNGWDSRHVERYEASWIAMAKALHTGERVHIVVYDSDEQNRVSQLLADEGLSMGSIDFFVWKTDDVWIRDNGPQFVFDQRQKLNVQNWEFNGWGNKSEFQHCNQIPGKIARSLGLPLINVPMVNEGGSIEVDGKGTLMAKRSSILNNNRNPGWTQDQVENYFKQYLGVSNFIWLEGVKGGDITDDHIDGTARFAGESTIVTYFPADSERGEYEILSKATNAQGESYRIFHLPITQNNVGSSGEKGIYINFYVANTVVLVPNFGDPNDAVANATLQSLYPNKTVVGIESSELLEDGGMVHCVTMQQPAG